VVCQSQISYNQLPPVKDENREPSGDYKMIQSVEINNFRGFQKINLKNLSRINILVGDNGSGKTAFLEALFLTGGLGPEIYLRTRAWRGTGDKFIVGLDRDQYEALWKEIFYSLDQNKSVIIKFLDSASGERELRIYYDAAQTTLMPIDLRVRTSYESGDIHPISFEWRTQGGKVQKVTAEMTPQGVMQLPQIMNMYPIMFLSSGIIFSPEENARRFSFLSRRNRQPSVIKIIRSLFPIVEDLSVEIVAGAAGLYASVEGLEEKIAVGSLSGGLTKYLAILFGIASFPKGVVIIDEIENGFFYRKYSDVWNGITSLAAEHETQLFVSTHSIECLQAVLPVVSENPSLFTLLRTERQGNECFVKSFSGKDLQAGLEQRIEFR
jgi:ABC-type branched-subunit amino acid transport system ATPase component